ncbi:hypothetical protein FACS1894219_10210 [Clostridia bacterium]|nr:hypothetical protein FACS1894219_10210 [Clostridia bacterium]
MRLQDWFRRTTAHWAAYSKYEILESEIMRYIVPTVDATVNIYDPLKIADEIVVDALNIGIQCVRESPDEVKITEDILAFAAKYGLLGFMTALPTTPDFTSYEAVYLPKNPVIKHETMGKDVFMNLFFPPEREERLKQFRENRQKVLGGDWGNGIDMLWVNKDDAKVNVAFRSSPEAKRRTFERGYAEPWLWLRNQFRDWASLFCSAYFYYDEQNETMRELHRRSIEAFGGVAPHYTVVLEENKPQIKWDFHSLLQTIHIMLSFALADEAQPLRLCKECTTVYYATDKRSQFCSPECKNRYGVRQSRKK